MARVLLQEGQRYGVIELIAPEYNGAGKKIWRCRCLRCGKEFTTSGQYVLLWQDRGCSDCHMADKLKEREAEVRKHIGERHGDLEILDFAEMRYMQLTKAGKMENVPFVRCKCYQCGKETIVRADRVLNETIKTCVECARENLHAGHEIAQKSATMGSSALHANPARKTNKNNSTGVKGVSIHKQTGLYRATITFRRHQYGLGLYKTLDEAAAARKAAEEKYFGNFLEWYAETYPENWAKLQAAQEKKKQKEK